MRRLVTILLLFLGPLLHIDVAAADVGITPQYYELDTGREIALIVGGGLVLGGAFLLQRNLPLLDDADLAALEGKDLHGGFLGIDRPASRNWSPRANRASDVTLRLTQLGPLLQSFYEGEQSGEDTGTLLMMYGETVLLTSATNQLLKVLTHRTRPFVYNPDPSIPAELKRKIDARRSFPSGHAAGAFASAVHFSMVYERVNGNQSSGAVWGASLGLATLTGYLRYAAGKHHPSDILVGAVLGSFVGWLVPTLHESEASKSGQTAPTLSFGFGF
jgi:membrane-associated phospholipid phosphatase